MAEVDEVGVAEAVGGRVHVAAGGFDEQRKRIVTRGGAQRRAGGPRPRGHATAVGRGHSGTDVCDGCGRDVGRAEAGVRVALGIGQHIDRAVTRDQIDAVPALEVGPTVQNHPRRVGHVRPRFRIVIDAEPARARVGLGAHREARRLREQPRGVARYGGVCADTGFGGRTPDVRRGVAVRVRAEFAARVGVGPRGDVPAH